MSWKEFRFRVEQVGYAYVVARDEDHAKDIFGQSDLDEIMPYAYEWDIDRVTDLRETCRCCLDAIRRAKEDDGFFEPYRGA